MKNIKQVEGLILDRSLDVSCAHIHDIRSVLYQLKEKLTAEAEHFFTRDHTR